MSYARQFVKSLPIKNPTHKSILGYFADFCGADGVCRESQKAIAADSGYGLRTIVQALAALERGGFVVRKKTRAQKGTAEIDRVQLVGYTEYVAEQRARNSKSRHAPQAPVVQAHEVRVAEPGARGACGCEPQDMVVDGLFTTAATTQVPEVRVAARGVKLKSPPPSFPPSSFSPTPPHITTPLSPPASNTRGTRATRIASDWRVDEKGTAFARSKGLSTSEIDNESEKFLDYWIARSGAGGTKVCWAATWRTWVRNAVERNGNGNRSRHAAAAGGSANRRGPPSETDAARRALAILKSRHNGGGDGRADDPFPDGLAEDEGIITLEPGAVQRR